jgi:putative ABC transport system permease protein
MSTLLHDLRYIVRTYAQSPGFSAVAILTLALGIGANTTILSLVSGILLRPLPYSHPDQIVHVSWQGQGYADPIRVTSRPTPSTFR